MGAQQLMIEAKLAALPEQRLLSRLFPLIWTYTETHTTTISTMELLMCRWVAAMQRCLDLQDSGVPMFCARYGELRQAPRAVLDAMLSYCGLWSMTPRSLVGLWRGIHRAAPAYRKRGRGRPPVF